MPLNMCSVYGRHFNVDVSASKLQGRYTVGKLHAPTPTPAKARTGTAVGQLCAL